jgi:hypothetical protein
VDSASVDRAAAKARAQEADANLDIDTSDDSTRTNTDGGGGGSQGRAFQEGEANPDEQPTEEQEGLTRDEDGQLHLDLEA